MSDSRYWTLLGTVWLVVLYVAGHGFGFWLAFAACMFCFFMAWGLPAVARFVERKERAES